MKSFFNLSFLIIVQGLFSQTGVDNWRMYISPNSAVDVAYGNKVIYGILEKGLLEYDIESSEQTIWTTANYLSDVSPTAIAFHQKTNNLLIGYDNGNFDLIKNSTVYNLPYIFKSNVQGIKRINKIALKDDFAYLATGVGVVVVDIKKREIKDTYNPSFSGDEYIDITFLNDSIYVLTQHNVYVANIYNDFLIDPNQWKEMEGISDYAIGGRYKWIETFNDKLFLVFNNDSIGSSDTIYRVNNGIPQAVFTGNDFFGIKAQDDRLLIFIYDGLYVYDNELNIKEVIYQYKNNIKPRPQNACYYNGEYYIADRDYGLVKARDSYHSEFLDFEGPRYNSAYRAKWLNDKLVIACGGFYNTSPSFSLKGGSVKKNKQWTSIDISEQKMLQNVHIWDFISVAINPIDDSEEAFGTNSSMPLVLTRNGVVTDTFGFYNSPIERTGTMDWGNVSDLTYDDYGNLWLITSYAVKPLKVRTSNGDWFEFDLGNSVKDKQAKRIVIDKNNVKWMSVKGAGLIAFDHGENIGDLSGDRYKIFNSGANSGDLPSNDIEDIAIDFDNNIWVGTPEGMRVFYHNSDFFDAEPGEYNFQKLLIEYGENVEIVLGTTHITSIKIDGANRKWIGTATSGVFLLSPNGLEIEKNFTVANSPLLSNTILDIVIDHSSGEVFFITEQGMIVYGGDASQGDSEYNNVEVFPNPVYPDYSGKITIRGIAYDSDVRITDVSGKLVYKTKSNGGMATWSGNTMDGNRAATGVYLIWTSIDDIDFKGRKVGKVLLLN